MKREDYISWDDYFMGIALLSGMRSKDPSTQVGACVVDKDNRIVSIGYNAVSTTTPAVPPAITPSTKICHTSHTISQRINFSSKIKHTQNKQTKKHRNVNH